MTGRMRTPHESSVRDALWRLTDHATSSDNVLDDTPRLFLRSPSIAALWMVSLLGVVAVLALARIRIPRVIHGAAVAVGSPTSDVRLMLFLPASALPHVRAGQFAELATENGKALVLDVVAVEPDLLDPSTAHRRFAGQPSVLAQLDGPRVVAHLSTCPPTGCLTLRAGDTYRAAERAGTRSLASYAMSGS